MKRSSFALALLGMSLFAFPVFAGVADDPLPELEAGKPTYHLYSVPGVIRSGGVGTFFSCTSMDTAPMQVCVEVFTRFGFRGSLDCSVTSLSVGAGETKLFATQPALWVSVDSSVGGGVIVLGAARILATAKKLACTAFLADEQGTPPVSMSSLPIIAKTKQKAAN